MCGTSVLISDRVQLLPVVEALSTPALKHYHWDDIAAVLGHEIVVDNSLTLSKFIGFDVVAHLVAVQQIAHVAKKVCGVVVLRCAVRPAADCCRVHAQEADIEAAMEKIAAGWTSVTLETRVSARAPCRERF